MMSFFKASARRTLIVVLLSVMAFSAHAQVAASEDGKSWTVNIRNADIQAFISQIADMTGKNFVVDPRVRARDVTVVSTKALSAAEVYELFLSVLQVHGYAAVPSGDIIKIVPNTTAKQSNLPLVGKNESGGEALVTRVIPVENSPVEELVPVLRPLVPQYGHLAAVGSANALIISDHMDNIRRMEAIIASLDNAESEDVQVIKLEHAFAGDMVKMLESLTPQTGGRRGKTKDGGVTVVADERTNRLIIKGDRITRQRMAQMIGNLDTPASATGGVQVVRLSHGDAEALAELLKNFAEGASAAKPGADGKTAAASITGDKVSIQADKSLNALVIRAEPAMMKEIMSVISQLDVRRAQILIEAAIVEVSGDTGKALGFQYVGGSDESGVGAINFGNAGLTINSIVQALATDDPSGLALGDGITMGFGEQDSNGDLKWGALIQALSTSTDVNLLSTPSILTLDNQEASIVVGENVPFITGTSTSTGSGVSNPFQTIQREDVGLSLKVTPHVAGLSTIRLELEQENSQVKDSVGEAADIVTTTRKLESTVLADDGETIALGGLIRDNITKTVRKVPILGDIPLLGILFRSTSNSREKSNLMVFLRPTILPDNERLLSMTRQKYMGITALQFELNRKGELEQVVRNPLPVSLEKVFQGRSSASVEYRDAYEAEQNDSPKNVEVEDADSEEE
ncbi:general (type II) secretion pathway protein D [Alcanivorax jadensis T9]|jgi:general secretion pathway protein D|uniref:General (Type II) secretion pathway protein D n=1 Tax=Alcanivorax jadensis T9 TaxID=1177181 RepID=A0ABR4W9B4_9GAMM|nr:type II secretion system secretin GspD [Alcanivorax jadensis]KGD59994.1 general (type II) secretion pathway protein D [Alcanivorax jadensis T9]MDF1638488.1 type II secretion system secretin GspD [Alcanivorax jadensis]